MTCRSHLHLRGGSHEMDGMMSPFYNINRMSGVGGSYSMIRGKEAALASLSKIRSLDSKVAFQVVKYLLPSCITHTPGL